MATAAARPPPPSSSSAQHEESAVVCKPRPLMLKDFLREDQNSDSFGRRLAAVTGPGWGAGASAASANTMRYLLTMELNSNASDKRKGTTSAKVPSSSSSSGNAYGCSGGTNPLSRLSAVINALKMLPFSNSSGGALTGGRARPRDRPKQQQQVAGMQLTRSLSKRLRRSFWKKCGADSNRPCCQLAARKVLVRDIVCRASLDDEKSSNGGGNGKAPPPPMMATAATTKKTGTQIPPSPSCATSTAGSSPARASCSTSGSSWSELDSSASSSSSGSGSGSESAGSSSSPVPDFAKPVVASAAAAAASCLSAERSNVTFDRDDDEAAASPARRSVGGGTADLSTVPTGHRYTSEVDGADGKAGNDGGRMHFTCVQYEDKDQLSPVAVAEFPSSSSSDEEENDDGASLSDTHSTEGARHEEEKIGGGREEEEEEEEEEEADSTPPASFRPRLASIERVKHRLLWKIQKFETLADLVEPTGFTDAGTAQWTPDDDDAYGDESDECYDNEDEEEEEVDQEGEESTSSSAEDVEVRARALLERLKEGGDTRGLGQGDEVLLLDLFIQGLWEHGERAGIRWRRTAGCIDDDGDDNKRRVEDDLVTAARAWVAAEGVQRGLAKPAVDIRSKAALMKELDKDGPWGQFLDGEEDEVVLAAADGVLDSLLAELLLDMLTYFLR